MNLLPRLRILTLIIAVTAILTGCARHDTSYTSGFGTPKDLKQYQQADDLWQVLGKNFDLPDESDRNPAVAWQINWFMNNPVYLQRMAESAAPFLYYIYQQVKKRHLPAELTLLPMVESAYDPFATNYGSGAAGLWQMMPSTASGFGLRLDWWYDGRRDVIASTNAALNYFVFLGKFFDGDWLLAMAAYDSGEGTVAQAMQRNAKVGKPTEFWYLSLPYETETYVPKLLALATIIKYPNRYPVKLPPIKNVPYLASVDIGSQIDLARAAKMAGLSLDSLAALNPGFNRWATDPDGPHTLVLPISHAARFKTELAKLPPEARLNWHRITVTSGDTLIYIAKKYDTNIDIIRQINRLKDNAIYPGQALLIPSSHSKAMNELVLQHEHDFYAKHHTVRIAKITRHTVTAKDSLWKIAKQYHVTVKQIRFWNSLPSNYVSVGTSLIIWPPKTKAKGSYWEPTYLHYTVKSGDSLWSIAHKHQVSISTLTQLNDLQHHLIKPGQALKIPIAHESIVQAATIKKARK